MASKVSVVGIVAWVLVVILAIGAGALGFMFKSQSSQAAGLREAGVALDGIFYCPHLPGARCRCR